MCPSESTSAVDALATFFLTLSKSRSSTADLKSWGKLLTTLRIRPGPDAVSAFARLCDRYPVYTYPKDTPVFPTGDVLVCLAKAFRDAGRNEEFREAIEQAVPRVGLDSSASVRKVLKDLEQGLDTDSTQRLKPASPESRKQEPGPQPASQREQVTRYFPIERALDLIGGDVPPGSFYLVVLKQHHSSYGLHKAGFGLLVPPKETSLKWCGVVAPALCEVLRALLSRGCRVSC